MKKKKNTKQIPLRNYWGKDYDAKDIIGDIYFKQGNKEEAKKHYLEGLELYKGQGDIRKVLQNKIDSIGQ